MRLLSDTSGGLLQQDGVPNKAVQNNDSCWIDFNLFRPVPTKKPAMTCWVLAIRFRICLCPARDIPRVATFGCRGPEYPAGSDDVIINLDFQSKSNPGLINKLNLFSFGGRNRIWTCDTSRYARFPSECIQPLCHPSKARKL